MSEPNGEGKSITIDAAEYDVRAAHCARAGDYTTSGMLTRAADLIRFLAAQQQAAVAAAKEAEPTEDRADG